MLYVLNAMFKGVCESPCYDHVSSASFHFGGIVLEYEGSEMGIEHLTHYANHPYSEHPQCYEAGYEMDIF